MQLAYSSQHSSYLHSMNMKRIHLRVNNKSRQFRKLCRDCNKGVSTSLVASFIEVTYKMKYNPENMVRVSCSRRVLSSEKFFSFTSAFRLSQKCSHYLHVKPTHLHTRTETVLCKQRLLVLLCNVETADFEPEFLWSLVSLSI